MITLQSLRHFILACLVISLSTQPMGWFDTTWKKLGFGVAAAVLVGVMYRYKKYQEKYGSQTIVINRPPELPLNTTPDQEVFHTVKAMLDHDVDPNFRPHAHTYFFINGYRRGFWILPLGKGDLTVNNLLERGVIAQKVGRNDICRYRFTPIQCNFRFWRDDPDFIAAGLVRLMDDHTYKRNTNAIAKRVNQITFQTQCHSESDTHIANFNQGVSDIIGQYTAEKYRDARTITTESQ